MSRCAASVSETAPAPVYWILAAPFIVRSPGWLAPVSAEVWTETLVPAFNAAAMAVSATVAGMSTALKFGAVPALAVGPPETMVIFAGSSSHRPESPPGLPR